MNETSVEQLISRRLRDLRKARGVTLDELASMTGFTKGYLSKIENGRKVPPIETLSRISTALHAEIAYFLRDVKGESKSGFRILFQTLCLHEADF